MNSKPPRVRDAVILMAGMGSRLRANGHDIPKPLFPFLGRPLAVYTLEILGRAGVTNIYAVTGFEHEIITSELAGLAPKGVKLQFIHNPEFRKQNGISVLCAAGVVPSPFLLSMSDHLFEDAVVELMAEQPEPDVLSVAIDRKIESIFDLPDAMKIMTEEDRVVEIGKELSVFDAIDTGLFLCSSKFFDYLTRAKQNEDCSLADGVRLAASEGKATVVDIEEAWWQDVDTREMLREAERRMRESSSRSVAAKTSERQQGQGEAAHADREPEMQNPLRQARNGQQ